MSYICQAIRDLRLISFDYDDHYRVVEPHTFGVDKYNQVALRAYQIRGGSASEKTQGWKLFRGDYISGVTLLEETFSGPRREYRKDDEAFATIQCQL